MQYHSQIRSLWGVWPSFKTKKNAFLRLSAALREIRSLREVRENKKTCYVVLAVVHDRAIAASEEELRTAENEAEIEWQRDEATARIRAHFQDAGAADRVVDRKEFSGLIRALRELPSLGSSFDLSFDAFRGGSVSGDSDMDRTQLRGQNL